MPDIPVADPAVEVRVGVPLLTKLAVAGVREVSGVQDVEDVFFGLDAAKGAVLYMQVSPLPDTDRSALVRRVREHVRHTIERFTGVALAAVEIELHAEEPGAGEDAGAFPHNSIPSVRGGHGP